MGLVIQYSTVHYMPRAVGSTQCVPSLDGYLLTCVQIDICTIILCIHSTLSALTICCSKELSLLWYVIFFENYYRGLCLSERESYRVNILTDNQELLGPQPPNYAYPMVQCRVL